MADTQLTADIELTCSKAEVGRKYAMTTVRSRAARFHWPLSGDEIEERADAARPIPVR